MTSSSESNRENCNYKVEHSYKYELVTHIGNTVFCPVLGDSNMSCLVSVFFVWWFFSGVGFFFVFLVQIHRRNIIPLLKQKCRQKINI